MPSLLSRLPAALLAAGWVGLGSLAWAEEPVPEPSLEERVARLEKRLDLIDRKFEVLGARDEAELLGAEELLTTPALLVAKAKRAVDHEKLELAFRYLSILQSLHPESREAAENFPLACSLFKKGYYRARIAGANRIFLDSEPTFMYQWLGRFYGEAAGAPFPQEQAEALFLGMPLSLTRGFNDYARSRPRLRAWEIRAREDNGLVEELEAVRTSDESS